MKSSVVPFAIAILSSMPAAAQVNAGVDATRAVDAATASVRAIDEAARDETRRARRRADAAEVRASAGVKVDRGTRCSGDAGRFDASDRDGHWHCDRRTGEIAAGARRRD